MSGQRVRRAVSDLAEKVIRFTANATNSVLHNKILLLGALAALSVVVAIPILCRADMPSEAGNGTLKCYDSAGIPILCRTDMLSVAANSPLKCYDSAGNYQPCVTRASASALRTTRARRPVSWASSEPSQQASWATTAPYQQANWTTTAVIQPANLTISAPAARRSSTPGKRRSLSICGRHLIPCFFSALRRGVTHMASVAAIAAGARSAREHL
jgi:hypothetical protein